MRDGRERKGGREEENGSREGEREERGREGEGDTVQMMQSAASFRNALPLPQDATYHLVNRARFRRKEDRPGEVGPESLRHPRLSLPIMNGRVQTSSRCHLTTKTVSVSFSTFSPMKRRSWVSVLCTGGPHVSDANEAAERRYAASCLGSLEGAVLRQSLEDRHFVGRHGPGVYAK